MIQSFLSLFTRIRNKYFLIAFVLVAIYNIALSLNLSILEAYLVNNFTLFFTIVIYLSLFFFYKNSSYRYAKLFKWNNLFIATFIIAALFKIQHYPYASEIRDFSFLGLITLYFVYAFIRPDKNLTTVLKLFYAISIMSWLFIRDHHLKGLDTVYYISLPLCYLTILSTVWDHRNDKAWFNQ